MRRIPNPLDVLTPFRPTLLPQLLNLLRDGFGLLLIPGLERLPTCLPKRFHPVPVDIMILMQLLDRGLKLFAGGLLGIASSSQASDEDECCHHCPSCHTASLDRRCDPP